MIIDAHTHLFPDEVRRNRRAFCSRDEGFRLLYGNEKARMASVDDLISAMDREGVDRSVICAFPWKDPGMCRQANDYLFEARDRHPGRLIPFAALPLRSLREARRERDRTVARGVRGIGEVAFYGKEMSAGHVRRLSAVVRDVPDLPLLLHVNEPVGHHYPGKGPPAFQMIYALVRGIPNGRIILAHWGGGIFLYELMPEVAGAFGSVFYDTAASPFLYRPEIYRLALSVVGSRRILFGSDFPLLAPGRYFREMQGVGMPSAARRDIQGLDARNLFKLW
ncbi:MAG TPA: amidohydrolase family protein [Thermodesulfobacteriota bacterium]|nr:amidohydrolase family protein [Thermodesulfobacteriota bacterium]